MGASKQTLFDEVAEADQEIVAECDWCGKGVTAERLNEMPYDGGEPAFVMCKDCDVRDDKEQQIEAPDEDDFGGPPEDESEDGVLY